MKKSNRLPTMGDIYESMYTENKTLFDDPNVQMLVDIIGTRGVDKSKKYIDMLKDKYGVDYYSIDSDDNYIENVSLDDIKSMDDFISYDKYLKYSSEVYKLRNIPLVQMLDIYYDFDEVVKLGEILDFSVELDEYEGHGNFASASVRTISVPSNIDVNSLIHEIGHIFDFSVNYEGLAKASTHASSPYEISIGSEVFAENFTHYFTVPNLLKRHLPEVYRELDRNIPKKYKKVIGNLLKGVIMENKTTIKKKSNTLPTMGDIYEPLSEKSVSKSQQRLMGMAWAVRQGDMSRDDAPESVLKLADSDISDKDLKDFASTKHTKGSSKDKKELPNKVEDEKEEEQEEPNMEDITELNHTPWISYGGLDDVINSFVKPNVPTLDKATQSDQYNTIKDMLSGFFGNKEFSPEERGELYDKAARFLKDNSILVANTDPNLRFDNMMESKVRKMNRGELISKITQAVLSVGGEIDLPNGLPMETIDGFGITWEIVGLSETFAQVEVFNVGKSQNVKEWDYREMSDTDLRTIVLWLKKNNMLTESSKGSKIKPYEMSILSAITDFLKDKWGFSADITFKKKKSKNLIGDIQLDKKSIVNNRFVLTFNPNQSHSMIIRSLIHELTHVKQVSKGELGISQDSKYITWGDQYSLSLVDYGKVMRDFDKYKELPWEVEAYSNMKDSALLDELFSSKQWQSLRGTDPTLDFILDNI